MSVPKWPDFSIERIGETVNEQGRATYAIRTDTGRPGTPVYNLWASLPVGCSDRERRMIAKWRLQDIYEKAHPNGCPGTH